MTEIVRSSGSIFGFCSIIYRKLINFFCLFKKKKGKKSCDSKMFPLLLLRESAQKLTWQESTFTNYVHLLKAADQLEKAISKVQNENTNRHVWRLTTMNAFMQALSFLSQVSLAELLWQFFFSFLPSPAPPPLHLPSLSLKLMKRNDQNARRQMESLCFGVLICETGRCYTKNKWWQFPL